MLLINCICQVLLSITMAILSVFLLWKWAELGALDIFTGDGSTITFFGKNWPDLMKFVSMKEFESIDTAACPGGKYTNLELRVDDIADLDCTGLVKHKNFESQLASAVWELAKPNGPDSQVKFACLNPKCRNKLEALVLSKYILVFAFGIKLCFFAYTTVTLAYWTRKMPGVRFYKTRF
jgi:hypothetical protein